MLDLFRINGELTVLMIGKLSLVMERSNGMQPMMMVKTTAGSVSWLRGRMRDPYVAGSMRSGLLGRKGR